MISLEMCIEHLIYAKEELECSQTPFYLEELKEALGCLIIFENDIDNFMTKKHIRPDFSLVTRIPPKVQKRYADFEYVYNQIEGALIELGHLVDWWGEEWGWLCEDLEEVTQLVINLEDDIDAVKRIMNVIASFNPPAEFYDFLSFSRPRYKEVIQKLKKLNFPVNRHHYIADPTQKELPRPKSGSYRKGRQTFTTFATGSKAMLVLQGKGKTADRSHIQNHNAGLKIRNK